MMPRWQDRRVVAVAVAAGVLVVGAVLFWVLRSAPGDDALVDVPAPPGAGTEELRAYELYFPGADGRLHAEVRQLEKSPEPLANVTRLVEALLQGPNEQGLWPTLPEGVTLAGAYMTKNDTVVLDLASADGTRPSLGSKGELLQLYSLVNTVLLNVDEAERVMVLWNGHQPDTFAGHVDTTRPLRPATDLIAR